MKDARRAVEVSRKAVRMMGWHGTLHPGGSPYAAGTRSSEPNTIRAPLSVSMDSRTRAIKPIPEFEDEAVVDIVVVAVGQRRQATMSARILRLPDTRMGPPRMR